MGSNQFSSIRKNLDGSVSEDMVLNGYHVTLRFAPDSEQDNSAEALRSVRETLFRELTETGKLAKSINN